MTLYMVAGSGRDYLIEMDIHLETFTEGVSRTLERKQTICVVEEIALGKDISSMSVRELTSNECAGRIVLSLLTVLLDMITFGRGGELLKEE